MKVILIILLSSVLLINIALPQVRDLKKKDSLIVKTDSLKSNSSITKDSIAFADSSASLDTMAAMPIRQRPKLDMKAFDVGERLTFKIRYGFIKAGEAQMKVMGKMQMKGEEGYHFQTTAKTVPAFDIFFKVRDVVNSYVTTDGFFSLRFEKTLREGNYCADLFVDYLHLDSTARVEFIRYENSDLEIRERKKYDVKIHPYILDILSSFYYVRNLDLRVGKSVFLSNHDKDKIYDLEIKVYNKEEVDVDAGEFRCFVVEPLLKGEGIFKKKGRLQVWLTDDELKIPVQMTCKIAVGHITTELIKIEGIKKPIRSKLD